MLEKLGIFSWLVMGISSSVVGFLLITMGKMSLLMRDIALNTHSEKPKDYYEVILKLSSVDTILGWIIIIGGWTYPILLSLISKF